MGLGGGVECESHQGYHMRDADMFFEVIDPNTGLPTQEGEEGEIVFTTLTRTGMPLIRYRMGDLSRFLPGKCPCGSNLHQLEKVQTRLVGRIPLGNNYYQPGRSGQCPFRFEEIFDFNTKLVQSGNKNQLQLTIFTPFDPTTKRIEASVMDQVLIINSIHQSMQIRPFELKITFENLPTFPISPRKRTIDFVNLDKV
jgi:phenylacetate-coenzyme A ligase PaaK-like adenylate-forming protein